MTNTDQNFQMYQGDTEHLVVIATDEAGAPVDVVSGYITWVLYKPQIELIVLTKNTTSGVVMINPTQGEFAIHLNPIDTVNLLGKYYHECQYVDEFDNVSTLFTGICNIYRSMTTIA